MSNETCEYKLKRPFGYSEKGQNAEASFLTLQEPEYLTGENFMKIEYLLSSCQAEMAKMISDEDKEEIKEQQQQEGVLPYQDDKKFHEIDRKLNLEKDCQIFSEALKITGKNFEFLKAFSKLIIKNRRRPPLLVNDNKSIPVNSVLWGKMHIVDKYECAVRWAVFFVLASDEQRKELSGNHTDSHISPREL